MPDAASASFLACGSLFRCGGMPMYIFLLCHQHTPAVTSAMTMLDDKSWAARCRVKMPQCLAAAQVRSQKASFNLRFRRQQQRFLGFAHARRRHAAGLHHGRPHCISVDTPYLCGSYRRAFRDDIVEQRRAACCRPLLPRRSPRRSHARAAGLSGGQARAHARAICAGPQRRRVTGLSPACAARR